VTDKQWELIKAELPRCERRKLAALQKISLRRGMSSSARRSGSELKERSDELRVSHRITSANSFDLTFAYHVDGINTFQSSFRSMKPLEGIVNLAMPACYRFARAAFSAGLWCKLCLWSSKSRGNLQITLHAARDYLLAAR